MNISFAYASPSNLDWLAENDRHIPPEMLKKKIADRQILLAKSGEMSIGWLRFGFFWDEIPFMYLLFLLEDFRRQGIGKALVQYWENEMKKRNHKRLMTSSLSNEPAQHFYRKLGYRDAGALLLPKEALEIIFIKPLT